MSPQDSFLRSPTRPATLPRRARLSVDPRCPSRRRPCHMSSSRPWFSVAAGGSGRGRRMPACPLHSWTACREGPTLAAGGPEGVDGLAEWLDVDAVTACPAPPRVEGVELSREVRDPANPVLVNQCATIVVAQLVAPPAYRRSSRQVDESASLRGRERASQASGSCRSNSSCCSVSEAVRHTSACRIAAGSAIPPAALISPSTF